MEAECTNNTLKVDGSIFNLHGDFPKQSIADDAFGLDGIARAISTLLADRVSADGYAIGIEGTWGSGKTSLTNFVIEDLARRESLTLKVVRFEPWLVGRRQALLGDLFRGLRARIEEFRSDPLLKNKLTDANRDLIDRLSFSLEKYQALLEGADKGGVAIASVDVSLFTPPVSMLLSGLNWLSKTIVRWSRSKTVSIEELREQIRGDLQTLSKLSLNTRFIVIIDDIDRLEPAESIEILRLIRAVADFPLVTYLVCYDRPHLAEQIKTVIGVGDGFDYLQKVFQSIISLPPQEPFALRRHVRNLLERRFPEEFVYSAESSPGRADREAFFFDTWAGQFIRNPRSAVRLAEAVTLGWPNLAGQADFIDYVWLQLIKLERHDLYEWVRGYVVNVGSYRDGGRPGDEEIKSFAEKLRSILDDAGWITDRDRAGIGSFLPGVMGYTDRTFPKVFQIERAELVQFEASRRLGSPSHWRLYFAFDKPSYALDDDLISDFRRAAAATDTARGLAIVRKLQNKVHRSAGYYFGIFLERLFDLKDGFNASEQRGIATVLGEFMDDVPEPSGVTTGLLDTWRRAETLMLPSAASVFPQICSKGAAINWLASVVRSQGFSHGRPKSDSFRGEAWLGINEFEVSLEALLSRIYAMEVSSILRKPKPLVILYCWLQLGNSESLREKLAAFTMSDDGLLFFLESIRTWANSSDRGLYSTLLRTNVERFLDPKLTEQRVRGVAVNGKGQDLRKRAADIIRHWDFDEERGSSIEAMV